VYLADTAVELIIVVLLVWTRRLGQPDRAHHDLDRGRR
jgi:hypothetical protein